VKPDYPEGDRELRDWDRRTADANAAHEARLEAEDDWVWSLSDEDYAEHMRKRAEADRRLLEQEAADLLYGPRDGFKWKRGA